MAAAMCSCSNSKQCANLCRRVSDCLCHLLRGVPAAWLQQRCMDCCIRFCKRSQHPLGRHCLDHRHLKFPELWQRGGVAEAAKEGAHCICHVRQGQGRVGGRGAVQIMFTAPLIQRQPLPDLSEATRSQNTIHLGGKQRADLGFCRIPAKQVENISRSEACGQWGAHNYTASHKQPHLLVRTSAYPAVQRHRRGPATALEWRADS